MSFARIAGVSAARASVGVRSLGALGRGPNLTRTTILDTAKNRLGGSSSDSPCFSTNKDFELRRKLNATGIGSINKGPVINSGFNTRSFSQGGDRPDLMLPIEFSEPDDLVCNARTVSQPKTPKTRDMREYYKKFASLFEENEDTRVMDQVQEELKSEEESIRLLFDVLKIEIAPGVKVDILCSDQKELIKQYIIDKSMDELKEKLRSIDPYFLLTDQMERIIDHWKVNHQRNVQIGADFQKQFNQIISKFQSCSALNYDIDLDKDKQALFDLIKQNPNKFIPSLHQQFNDLMKKETAEHGLESFDKDKMREFFVRNIFPPLIVEYRASTDILRDESIISEVVVAIDLERAIKNFSQIYFELKGYSGKNDEDQLVAYQFLRAMIDRYNDLKHITKTPLLDHSNESRDHAIQVFEAITSFSVVSEPLTDGAVRTLPKGAICFGTYTSDHPYVSLLTIMNDFISKSEKIKDPGHTIIAKLNNNGYQEKTLKLQYFLEDMNIVAFSRELGNSMNSMRNKSAKEMDALLDQYLIKFGAHRDVSRSEKLALLMGKLSDPSKVFVSSDQRNDLIELLETLKHLHNFVNEWGDRSLYGKTDLKNLRQLNPKLDELIKSGTNPLITKVVYKVNNCVEISSEEWEAFKSQINSDPNFDYKTAEYIVDTIKRIGRFGSFLAERDL